MAQPLAQLGAFSSATVSADLASSPGESCLLQLPCDGSIGWTRSFDFAGSPRGPATRRRTTPRSRRSLGSPAPTRSPGILEREADASDADLTPLQDRLEAAGAASVPPEHGALYAFLGLERRLPEPGERAFREMYLGHRYLVRKLLLRSLSEK
jgi:hypothetical protein